MSIITPEREEMFFAALRLVQDIAADDRKGIATEIRRLIDLGADQIPPEPANLTDTAAQRDITITDAAEEAKLGLGNQ